MDDRFKKDDLVILAGTRGNHLIRLEEGMVRIGGRRGAVSSGRIMGQRPGSVLDMGGTSFVMLRPDARDIQENLDRGPQIIIPKDSDAIIGGLGLSSGMRVLEGGAGSGALTCALLNAVAPDGNVETFDIKKEHLRKAGSNVNKTRWNNCWDGKLGDVSSVSFEGIFDAAVLDVPSPETAVGNIASSLRPGSRFCSYVPTMNQMERVYLELENTGFYGVEAIEIVHRPFSVKEGAVRPVHEILAHTGYLIFARWMGSL
jgi:tRNA (adenine57-N1/adenine58-N1)-methyltransferase